jgi:homogentisate 1,2-dioxygenase
MSKSTNTMPADDEDKLDYLSGFGNSLESEFIVDSLPRARNNPRTSLFYTEQLSGTAFTAPRCENKRTWLYRLQPSVSTLVTSDTGIASSAKSLGVFGKYSLQDCTTAVDPLRWKPLPDPTKNTVDFIASLTRVVAAGDSSSSGSLSIYLYACNASMNNTTIVTSHTANNDDAHPSSTTAFYNADGDFLIVPQQGRLSITTELGKLTVGPTEICVMPKGIVFRVDLLDSHSGDDDVAKGYVLEVCSTTGGFRLPELGPIGSNGLANARDFQHPVAWCVTDPKEYHKRCIIRFKMDSNLYSRTSDHTPFNVAAWHGNYLPCKYNLQKFCAMNSVTYDHPDPSIYTVLTYPSLHDGTALADFVIFPPRYMAADSNTFRPPWFHRNCMSEYMGLIYGQYDAKEGDGFCPGGSSLHNIMIPHGPDQATTQRAIEDPCTEPVYYDKGLAFMFESSLPMRVCPMVEDLREVDYVKCWRGLELQCDLEALQIKKS